MSKDMTVVEIKEALTGFGLEYDDKMNKAELLEVLNAETVEVAEEVPVKLYDVVHDFKDLKDKNKVYTKGGTYSSEGKSDSRIEELSSTKNKLKKVLIKERD